MFIQHRAYLLATCLVLAVTNTPLVSGVSTSASSLKTSPDSLSNMSTRASSHAPGAHNPTAHENLMALMDPDLASALKRYNETNWGNFANTTGLIEDGKMVQDTLLLFGSVFVGAAATAGGMILCPMLMAASPFMMVFAPDFETDASVSDTLKLRLEVMLGTFLSGVAAPFAGIGYVGAKGSDIVPQMTEHFVTSMNKKANLVASKSTSVFGTLKNIFNNVKSHKNPTRHIELVELQKETNETAAQLEDMLKETQTMLNKLENSKVPAKDQGKLDQSMDSTRQLVSLLTLYDTVWTEGAKKVHHVPRTCSKTLPSFVDVQRSLVEKFDENASQSE